MFRSTHFIAGNLARHAGVMGAVIGAALLAGCGDVAGKIKDKPDKAVAHFHEQLNAGQIDEILQDADPAIRAASTKEQFEKVLDAVHRKLGKVVSTTNTGWNWRSHNLKTTVSVAQETVFEHGKGTESFTFAIDGTNTLLRAYYIQSTDLISK